MDSLQKRCGLMQVHYKVLFGESWALVKRAVTEDIGVALERYWEYRLTGCALEEEGGHPHLARRRGDLLVAAMAKALFSCTRPLAMSGPALLPAHPILA